MKTFKRLLVSCALAVVFATTAEASGSFTVSKNVWVHESATLQQIGTDNAGTWTVTHPSLIRSGTNYNIISAWASQGKKTYYGGDGWYKLTSKVSAHATDNNYVTQSSYATFFLELYWRRRVYVWH